MNKKLFDQALIEYCEAHTTSISQVLHELERETHLKTLSPQMISGPLQVQLLQFISKMIQPACILEIGTFTGYSAICMAQGLQKDGSLHTIEANLELEYIIRPFLKKANLEDQIHLYMGDARTIVPTMDLTFDLVMIDAGKKDNGLYFDLVLDKIRSGGFILVDNVLWSGKVFAQNPPDKDTRLIHAFNKKIQEDDRVENVLLPIRDGLIVIRKL